MLKDDVAAYLAELAIRRAPKTVSSYNCGLNCYMKLYSELSVENVLAFAAWLHEHWSLGTFDLYLSVVYGFARWMTRKKRFAAESFMELTGELEFIRGGRKPQGLPKVPIEGDVQKIVGAANAAYDPTDTRRQKLMELRNIAILHTLRATGCRVSEVTDLRRGDLRSEDHAAVVTGKGRKERLVYFDKAAWVALTTYLEYRDKKNVGDLHEPVFCRYDRKATGKILPISTNVVRWVIRKFERVGETQEHIWPHRYRHRFGTLMLRQTHDLAGVQALLGHEDPKTTEKYAKTDDAYIRKVYEAGSL